VIAARLVLTAGHCVHSGSGNEQGWFTNLEFAPAYRDGVAPYSTWKAATAFVTDPWYKGQDKVPNVADYALIELEDQLVGGRINWWAACPGGSARSWDCWVIKPTA